jgi:hypothetical protein
VLAHAYGGELMDEGAPSRSGHPRLSLHLPEGQIVCSRWHRALRQGSDGGEQGKVRCLQSVPASACNRWEVALEACGQQASRQQGPRAGRRVQKALPGVAAAALARSSGCTGNAADRGGRILQCSQRRARSDPVRSLRRAFFAHPGEVAAAEAAAAAAQRAALRALPAEALSRVDVVASVCTDVPSFLHSQPTLTALAGAAPARRAAGRALGNGPCPTSSVSWRP